MVLVNCVLSVGSSLVSLPITTTLSVSSSLSVKVMTSSFLRQDNCEYKYNQNNIILQTFAFWGVVHKEVQRTTTCMKHSLLLHFE